MTPKPFSATLNTKMVKTYKEMLSIIQNRSCFIIDARSAGRFKGTDPEPRPSLPSGHMPHATNIPYNLLINPDTKTLLPKHELLDLFQNQLKLDLERRKPIVTTCGSGMTACIVYFGLEVVGANVEAVYDGSWTEYASIPGSVIEKDP